MTRRFAAFLHGPGQPVAGAAATAAFVDDVLHVECTPEQRVPASALSVTAAGFNQDDVALGWQHGGEPWALLVCAAEAKAALLEQAPAALRGHLRRWHRSVALSRNFWRAAIVATTTAALILTVGLWQHQRVVEWTAESISPERERRLGASIMDGVRNDGRLVEQSPALDAVREIGTRLTARSTRTYEWHLRDDPSVNAFAVPGGYIVVHTGLVHAADNAEELAGVLAHEIQHVEQRHTLQNLIYQLGWAALLTVVLGDPSAMTAILLLEMGNLKFSRDLETKADTAAVMSLQRAGIAPDGLAAFFRKLARSGDAPTWLSTHPATSERVVAVTAVAAASPCPLCQPLPYDWNEVRESLYRDELIRRPAKQPAVEPPLKP